MKHVNGWKSDMACRELLEALRVLGYDRSMKRQALQNVSDELRLVARRASAMGVPDAQIARTAEVTISTVRKWLGKGDNVHRDRDLI